MRPAPITLTYRGRTLTLAQWATRLGVSAKLLRERRRRQLPLKKILTAKVRRQRRFVDAVAAYLQSQETHG